MSVIQNYEKKDAQIRLHPLHHTLAVTRASQTKLKPLAITVEK